MLYGVAIWLGMTMGVAAEAEDRVPVFAELPDGWSPIIDSDMDMSWGCVGGVGARGRNSWMTSGDWEGDRVFWDHYDPDSDSDSPWDRLAYWRPLWE